MPEKRTLHLTLSKEPFDQIKSGIKKIEYREFKIYWEERLLDKSGKIKIFDEIVFRNGYNKDSPTLKIEWKGCELKSNRYGKQFEIYLGKVII
jgi:ASC-1-like (ASCH) protein